MRFQENNYSTKIKWRPVLALYPENRLMTSSKNILCTVMKGDLILSTLGTFNFSCSQCDAALSNDIIVIGWSWCQQRHGRNRKKRKFLHDSNFICNKTIIVYSKYLLTWISLHICSYHNFQVNKYWYYFSNR